MKVVRREDRKARVTYEADNVKPDRDFVLYIASSEEDVGLSLFPFKDDEGKGGYFLAVLSPKVEESASFKSQPKDVVFVLDTSGSMKDGNRIVQAKKALDFCLGLLKSQ